jgi:hypothetical protein
MLSQPSYIMCCHNCFSSDFERKRDMDTPEQPTCGKGLAENSILPAKLGQLVDAMAENLRVHMHALDLTDQNSCAEYDA